MVVDIKNILRMRRLSMWMVKDSIWVLGYPALVPPISLLLARNIRRLKRAAYLSAPPKFRTGLASPATVCNAAPSGDTIPTVLIYGARAVIEGPGGRREVALEDFFLVEPRRF